MPNNSSSGDPGSDRYLKLPFEFFIFRLSLQIAIDVFGVIGNLVVIVKIFRGTNAFFVMTPYILSLAFADLGIMLINYPLAILRTEHPNGDWFLGEEVCLYVVPFAETFFGASIWSITAIAAERYAKVVWKFTVPISSGGRWSSKRILLIVTSIWVASFLIQGLPLHLHYKYHSGICYPDYPVSLHHALSTVNAILMYVLPLGIIAFSYQRIGKLVKERAVKLRDQTPNPSLDSSRSTMKRNVEVILIQTRKTQRILKPLVILFAVTMLPFHAFVLTIAYWVEFPNQSYYKILTTLTITSVAINSAADPLVYGASNEVFRRKIRAAFTCCFPGISTKWRLTNTFRMSSRRSRSSTSHTYMQAYDDTAL